ncbi:MAG TPA: polysaccharide biosynthesis protein [Lysobacter sp.]|nr:polysaccharide biosynthesis protein [Lysobacter sp.]
MTSPDSLSQTEDRVVERHASNRSIVQVPDDNRSLTPAHGRDVAVITPDRIGVPQVDAFREVRTRLLSIANDHNIVTLVVPVSRGSGGSFVARNLAAATAFDESKSAVLVDCDLHHPSQHTTMQVEPSKGGLLSYLDNPATLVSDILYETGIPRLRLIPAGGKPSRHAEYFSSFRMRLLIDSLRSRYPDRYLFLDGPAVRGAPDARILSEIADVVVLVAGYGRDTPEEIARAAANFDPAKFAGVVFNEGA